MQTLGPEKPQEHIFSFVTRASLRANHRIKACLGIALGKPPHFVPIQSRKFHPKLIPIFCTRVDPFAAFPNRKIFSTNSNLRQAALNLYKVVRARTWSIPFTIPNNGRELRTNISSSITNSSVAIPIKKIPCWMPRIKP
jgi:hypothetical protein